MDQSRSTLQSHKTVLTLPLMVGFRYKSEQAYIFPEDQREQDRLDLQHALFLKSFGDDKLYLAPIKQAQGVLDLGCGTGLW